MKTDFDYKTNAGICDALRDMLNDMLDEMAPGRVDAYNIALAGAQVQREYDKNNKPDFEKMWRGTQENFNKMEARAIRLEKALHETRDMLIAYSRDLPNHFADLDARYSAKAIIERGYAVLDELP